MKILLVNEYFSNEVKTGANLIAYSTYYLLKNNNIETYFFSKDTGDFCYNQEINSLFPKSYEFNKSIYGQFLFRLNSLYNISAKRQFQKVLKKIQPDLVHVHITTELSLSILSLLRKYNIPYVLTVHDAQFVCPVMGNHGYCLDCNQSILNCIKKKCSRNNIFPSIYLAIKFYIYKKMLKKYPPKKIICPSIALKDYINKTRFANNIEFVCIPNSLDETFNNVKASYFNKNYFLFVGALNDSKGVGVLLEAIKKLPNNINFHFVGEGKQEEYYKQFAKENKLDNVKFLGKMNRQELISEYQNCIAVITPSIWFEIFGMINIEAFACGKPVIASKTGGIAEIIDDNINGLLFEPGNVQALVTCILKYWNNNDLVIAHGKEALNKVNELYKPKSYNDLLQKTYLSIIKGTKDD